MYNDNLYHYGIKGMKWGVRRYQNEDGSLTKAGKKRYTPTSIRSAYAKRQNDKIDKSFNRWRESDKARDNAIKVGLDRNKKLVAHETNPKNKDIAKEYRQANREYRKAIRQNTTYRKGIVKNEVGKDLTRKYLSLAKEAKKAGNTAAYNRYMNKYGVERDKARRAPQVAEARSKAIANMKRTGTVTLKSAAIGTAAHIGWVSIASVIDSKGNMKLAAALAGRRLGEDAALVKGCLKAFGRMII